MTKVGKWAALSGFGSLATWIITIVAAQHSVLQWPFWAILALTLSGSALWGFGTLKRKRKHPLQKFWRWFHRIILRRGLTKIERGVQEQQAAEDERRRLLLTEMQDLHLEGTVLVNGLIAKDPVEYEFACGMWTSAVNDLMMQAFGEDARGYFTGAVVRASPGPPTIAEILSNYLSNLHLFIQAFEGGPLPSGRISPFLVSGSTIRSSWQPKALPHEADTT